LAGTVIEDGTMTAALLLLSVIELA